MQHGKTHIIKKQFLIYHLALVLIGLCLSIEGCVKEDTTEGYEKDGKRYGITAGLFQGRWYHYYERGLSFADGEFWQKAERDFRSALQQREGDQRRARTYGVRFIEYFPRRELGIALFHQKQYQESIKELDLSLNAVVSAKAEFYLDKARQAKILKQTADKVAPQIVITSPTQKYQTNLLMVRLSGFVRDDTFVKSVQVNGEDVRIDLSAPEVQLNVEVPLKNGKNTVTVIAADIVGNSSQVQHTVQVDRMGPIISFDPPVSSDTGTSEKILVKGFVYDETTLAKLKVNGRDVPMPVTKEFDLEQYITLVPLQKELVIEASDALGNQTVARINLDNKRSMLPSILLAATDIPMIAGNQNSPGKSEEVTLSRDSIKPVIEIDDWGQNQSVYLDEAYLAGNAQDNEWVESLMLNEQPILRRPGKTVFFNNLVPLNIGANPFQFEAWDHSGNQTELTVNIDRKAQEVRDIGARMDLVIVPFLRKGSNDRFGPVIEEALLSELEKSNRFQMVSALGVDHQKLKDPNEAVRIGKDMGKNYVLTGTIIENENSLDIFANVIETDSSQIVTRKDVYDEHIDRRALKKLCRGLIIKLKDDLPLVEGKVSEVQGKRVRLEFTGEHRIVKGMRCILFREELRLDAQTERVVDRREIRLGSALITAVKKAPERKTVCEAKIYENENVQIELGHLVITQ